MSTRTASEAPSSRHYYELWGPSAIFILFVLLGCAYILLAKAQQVRQVYVTFVPVGFMVAYAIAVGLARFLRLRDDQAGDNIYYMGFLFTLTSLGASLYQFSASQDAEYIVKNFGIAIASTISGIALRVLFNQMRRDPVEVERVARLELAQASRRVRVELDQSIVEFNHFRRAMMQSIQEGFDEIRVHVDKVGQKLLAGLEEVTEKSAAPLEAASKQSGTTIGEMTTRIVTALESTAQKLASENERLSASANSIAGALDSVSNRLTAMQAPDEVIKIKLDPTIKGLGNAVDRFAKRIEDHDRTVGSVLEGVQATSESTREAVESLKGSTTELGHGVLEAQRSILAAVQSFDVAARSQSDQVAAVLKRTDDALAAVREMAAAALERDNKQSELLSKLMSPRTADGGEPIDVAAMPQATPDETAPRKSLWGFGGA